MKRFLLFAGADYYPGGGWDDFVGAFDSLEEARADGRARDIAWKEWFHVVDLETGAKIEAGDLIKEDHEVFLRAKALGEA